MDAGDLLILRAPKLNRRLERLLEQVQTDSSLRQWYLSNPAQVIMQRLFPEIEGAVSNSEINRGNRLLYSVLTNAELRSWAATYEEDLMQRAQAATAIEDQRRALETYLAVVDRSSIHADLARAVARYADPELIASLTWQPSARYRPDLPDVAVEIEIAVYAVAALAVFAFGVLIVLIMKPPPNQAFTRQDLMTTVNELDTALRERASQLRREGKLLDYGQRDSGFIG